MQNGPNRENSFGSADAGDSIFLPEILLHIFSYLTPQDLANVALVNHLFNEVAKIPSIWQSLISTYFPFLILNQNHLFDERGFKEIFTMHYVLWQRIADNIQIELPILLSALKEKCTPEQIMKLSDEDKQIILIIEKASSLMKTPSTLMAQGDNSVLQQAVTLLAKTLDPHNFADPAPICLQGIPEKMKAVLQMLAVGYFPQKDVSYSVIRDKFRELLVTDSQNPNALFYKIEASPINELKELKIILDNMFIESLDISELVPAQRTVFDRFVLPEQSIKDFDKLCHEYFGKWLSLYFSRNPKYSVGTFNENIKFVAYLAKNVFGVYSDAIYNKVKKEISAKEANQQAPIVHHYEQNSSHSPDNDDMDIESGPFKPKPRS